MMAVVMGGRLRQAEVRGSGDCGDGVATGDALQWMTRQQCCSGHFSYSTITLSSCAQTRIATLQGDVAGLREGLASERAQRWGRKGTCMVVACIIRPQTRFAMLPCDDTHARDIISSSDRARASRVLFLRCAHHHTIHLCSPAGASWRPCLRTVRGRCWCCRTRSSR